MAEEKMCEEQYYELSTRLKTLEREVTLVRWVVTEHLKLDKKERKKKVSAIEQPFNYVLIRFERFVQQLVEKFIH